MGIIGNPVETCEQVFELIENLTSQIQKRLEDPKSAGTRVSSFAAEKSRSCVHVARATVGSF